MLRQCWSQVEKRGKFKTVFSSRLSAEIMVFCAATNCTNRQKLWCFVRPQTAPIRSKSKVSTFKFPADPKIREEWQKNLKRESFQPTKHSRLCENHFTKESFDESYAIKLSLGLKPGNPQLKKTQYQLFLTSPTLDETRKEEGLVKMKVSFRPLRNAESWR